MGNIKGKNIVLGITGSIAAFKAAELASQLAQMGAELDVILTPAAEKFITPLTLQSVTGRHAYTESDLWGGEAHVLHVGLGHAADLLVIAPCTANTIAALAHGQANNLLTITALAAQCPLFLAPAMDGGMLDHPATRANLDLLVRRGAYVAGPAEGHLASGLLGRGRLVEPAELIGHIRLLLGRRGPLAGRKFVISAGGTQEPVDPVRVLTNRSSGKQGYAVAQAAIDAGADVVLITAPTALVPPVGARLVRVETARQMHDAVLEESSAADVLVMAAAVADFRPRHAAPDKLKTRDGVPQIEFEATEDILKAVAASKTSPELTAPPGPKSGARAADDFSPARGPNLVIGFAAESQDLLDNAVEKLKVKKLNMIVANDITARDAGFGVDTNRVTLIHENGDRGTLPLMTKAEVAEAIVARIARAPGVGMRILVMSDIHANFTALETVLEAAGQVDETWCLGDLVGYGPDPNMVIERVRELPHLTCVLGNHDVAVVGRMEFAAFNGDARRSLTWTSNVLTADNMEFLRSMPHTTFVRGDVTLAHGSPRDPVWEYVLNTLSARLNFEHFATPFCFVGHSHIPSIFQLDEKRDRVSMALARVGKPLSLTPRAIVNPGSVGQPRDRDPRAAFAVYDSDKRTWEARRVEYDIAAVQERVRKAGLPEKHAIRLAEGW